MKITDFYNRPKTIAIVADVNFGKSTMIAYTMEQLRTSGEPFNLVSYGLPKEIEFGQRRIWSLPELESTRQSVIFIDEFANLIDLDDRKKKEMVEVTFRLINHPTHNNIIVLSGLPVNYKKFISAKIETWMFGKCTIDDFINGSTGKKIIQNYSGADKGSSILAISQGEMMIYDSGNYYPNFKFSYNKKYDVKKDNPPIWVPKS